MSKNKINKKKTWKFFKDLFPVNRSLTGSGNKFTLNYLKKNILQNLKIKKIKSGSKIFDWKVPSEWNVEKAFLKNKNNKKIIDFKKNNLHLIGYSKSFQGILEKKKILKHIHTLKKYPNWIPYRTSYYSYNWGFCAAENLLKSKDFVGPFKVEIKTKFNKTGSLIFGEAFKKGRSKKEILLSTYCCHPSLANDNLSGILTASMLFNYISSIKTKFSYRLVIAPETIGALCFLKSSNLKNIIGGTILTCTAGPNKLSVKESFDKNHWINIATHTALKKYTNNNYKIYPFIPDGSDERQFSSPSFRINTPSVHKSKYYDYPEYHTSADDLKFISIENFCETFNFYVEWFKLIERLNVPVRTLSFGEYQLGKRNLYPNVGGAIKQKANKVKSKIKSNITNVTEKNLDAFHWIMHLADGSKTNEQISEISGLNLKIVNESIRIFKNKGLIY